ncbi:hypothetical protein SAY87_030882 [Trapa incisa]|uniref:Uncharacterized protein n=2 Tax=Trapa TaxID=22665 RepID=A0AAN7R423_TRANT|nr:hypothetical protein SAY87_030882 [Trapa incisa]KAK4787430.1 hypothetical protein SAY86_011263 [Trapa natans]
MNCLVSPAVSILRRRSSSNSRSTIYRRLLDDEEDDGGSTLLQRSPEEIQPVTVVVGKEKRRFLVDPFVLEEDPFRALIEHAIVSEAATTLSGRTEKEQRRKIRKRKRREEVIFVDVDSILFEHMLWLMRNDSPSLFQLNLEEMIDFYAQDY